MNPGSTVHPKAITMDLAITFGLGIVAMSHFLFVIAIDNQPFPGGYIEPIASPVSRDNDLKIPVEGRRTYKGMDGRGQAGKKSPSSPVLLSGYLVKQC